MSGGLSIADSAANALGEALPGIAGALLLLVVGLIGAAVVGRVTRRGLHRIGVDDLSARWGVDDVLASAGLPRSLSRTLARILRIVLTIVIVFASLSLLGLAALSTTLNEVVLFMPRLLVAVALIVAGLIVGGLVRERVDRLSDQMNLAGPLGAAAHGATLMVFGILALAQLGVPTDVLVVVLAIALGACGLTVALAFGLGGREVARQISAERYLDGEFRVGQHIALGEVEGEIVELRGGAALVEAADGTTARVPSHLLLASVVRVGARRDRSSGADDGGGSG